MVTVVTEGIFSYCSFKVKIDTDRYLGPEQATVRHRGEAVGHVSTIEYGSQFLSLGGVHHLTGGSKKEGRVACEMMMALGNKQPVELQIEGGASRRGRRPTGRRSSTASRSSACASAAARRRSASSRSSGSARSTRWWWSTTTSPACSPSTRPASCLDMAPIGHPPARPQVDAGPLLPGRQPGHRAGAAPTSPTRCRSSRAGIAKHGARPGLRLLMVSTTGEDAAWFVLDEQLVPRPAEMPAAVRRVVERIGENCEPSLVLGALRRRRRRQPARRRHREPGAADPLDQEPAGQRHLRRRAGLRLAGRRHHGDGRRGAHAGQQLRLGADAGDRRADRVHDAPRRLPRARRPHGPGAPARARCSPRGALAHGRSAPSRAIAVAAATRRRGGRRDERALRPGGAASARRRPLAFPARPDRLHRRRRRRERRRCRARRARLAALSAAARRAGRRAAAAARSTCRRRPARRPQPRARSRGAWSRPAGRMPRGGRFITRDGGGRRQRRRGADRRLRRAAASTAPMSTTAATSRCTSRRARRSRSALSPIRRAACAGLPLDGRFAVDAASPVRGIATSGWRGRSFSLGIADSVTVLATSASRSPTRPPR